MQYFWDWAVMPLLHDIQAKRVLEIGSSQGGNTDRILRSSLDLQVMVIDPCLDADLVAKYRDVTGVTVLPARSLDALPNLTESFDAILIDGDHNYYTVLNELKWISHRNLLSRRGVILFHDVGQPYGRRDLYYEPDRIPADAKSDDAPHGVLTAIEAFRSIDPGRWIYLQWGAEHGLGCLAASRSKRDLFVLWVKSWWWRRIRWRNRILRWSGVRSKDPVSWGPLGQDALAVKS